MLHITLFVVPGIVSIASFLLKSKYIIATAELNKSIFAVYTLTIVQNLLHKSHIELSIAKLLREDVFRLVCKRLRRKVVQIVAAL